MNEIKRVVNRLIACKSEEDWFEFKDSWYDAAGIGEYISSMSNAAAMRGKEEAYVFSLEGNCSLAVLEDIANGIN